MNRKLTNYLVLILNIVFIVTAIIFLSGDIEMLLTDKIIYEADSVKSIYNDSIIEFMVSNAYIILFIEFIIVILCTIVCAIQNKQNRKLCFWFSVFGLITITLIIIVIPINTVMLDINNIIFCIIPIFFASRNIINIKKNSPNAVHIISYILVIVISLSSILDFLPLIINFIWWIISIIILFIYIHKQEKGIEESEFRKKFNLILYWIIYLISFVIIILLIVYSILTTLVNNAKYEAELSGLLESIKTMENSEDDSIYFPVEKDNKYGFIDENGEEKISLEYDAVSYFFESYNNQYFALAKKADNFCIISKSNDKIPIPENSLLKRFIDSMLNYNTLAKSNSVLILSNSLYYFFDTADTQLVTTKNNDNIIYLTQAQDGYTQYYTNGKYTLSLVPQENNLFKVSIWKTYGENSSAIEYIPFFIDNTIRTFSDGSIEFLSSDMKTHGWYDTNGNKATISSQIDILDIRNNRAYFKDYTQGGIYYIIDLQNKNTIYADYIYLTNYNCILSQENKMALYDDNLNRISNEYDNIFC